MPQIHLRAKPEDVLAFKMEASVLYNLAARARASGADVAASTILTIGDMLSEGTTSEESYLPLNELNRSIEPTIEVALEAGISS